MRFFEVAISAFFSADTTTLYGTTEDVSKCHTYAKGDN